MKQLINYKEWTYIFECQECGCQYATDEVEHHENFWKEIVFTATCLKCDATNRLTPNWE